MRYCFLSHVYRSEQPVYGGRVKLNIRKIKSISTGDSSNAFEITLQNHWGTHIDAPGHFFDNGKTINDYPADFWNFKCPAILDVSLKEKELLKNIDLSNINKATDILLLRSGWSQRRHEDVYFLANPGISPELAVSLRNNLSNLRAIGIDWISVSSVADRESGRMAHKIFLDPHGPGNPILLIEDMYIPPSIDLLQSVLVVPLRIEGIDSSPCTVIGVI